MSFMMEIIARSDVLIKQEVNYLRVLSIYVTILSDNSVIQAFQYLKNHIWYLMNDKFGCYIILSVIEKNINQFKVMIENVCLKKLLKIVKKKSTRQIVVKLVEGDTSGNFSQKIFFNLVFKV
jgi:hypothetical protein